MRKLKFYKQANSMDCGPTCLRIIARYYGKKHNIEKLRNDSGYSKQGVSLLGLSDAAEKIGFKTRGVQLVINQLFSEIPLPAIAHWDQNHFVVVLPQTKRLYLKNRIEIADPKSGILSLTKDEFVAKWAEKQHNSKLLMGNILILEPTSEFYSYESDTEPKLDWKYIFGHLTGKYWQIFQVFIALLISSLLQLIFPFLAQSLVDSGINAQNVQYITIILFAQITLIFSRTIIDFIRSRLLLSISSILNLSMLSDFWIKITGLPIAYFDSIHTGDTMQRIKDNKQVQSFLTGSALNTIFSFFNLVVFSFVLLKYDSIVFLIFFLGNVSYFVWIKLFLKVRRKLNYESFDLSSKENNATLQLVQGMQEIKLHGAERTMRWEWEKIQASIYMLGFKTLTYNQIQQAGALLISQGKDIAITFFVAKLVVESKLTFGAMLAVQYIIGQLSNPVVQLIELIQSGQDAKISIERLNEIYQMKDEADPSKIYINELPSSKDIVFHNCTFVYPGSGNDAVLKNISLLIEEGKTTAIVGVSGSGKTTLLKLLLRFHENYHGEIKIGGINLKEINPIYWRTQCGAVLQDGYIFDDTIAKNICIGSPEIDTSRLIYSAKTANIMTFIDSLPNGFNTKIGATGTSISQGQKQRILIAREVYKDPCFIFFDEATNSLDSNNEKLIVENLKKFFINKTVVIVAHRLSTVKNADMIVVLDEGEIVEKGTHDQLTTLKGKYYELVKNQLELGN